jgi:hypothetical protein
MNIEFNPEFLLPLLNFPDNINNYFDYSALPIFLNIIYNNKDDPELNKPTNILDEKNWNGDLPKLLRNLRYYHNNINNNNNNNNINLKEWLRLNWDKMDGYCQNLWKNLTNLKNNNIKEFLLGEEKLIFDIDIIRKILNNNVNYDTAEEGYFSARYKVKDGLQKIINNLFSATYFLTHYVSYHKDETSNLKQLDNGKIIDNPDESDNKCVYLNNDTVKCNEFLNKCLNENIECDLNIIEYDKITDGIIANTDYEFIKDLLNKLGFRNINENFKKESAISWIERLEEENNSMIKNLNSKNRHYLLVYLQKLVNIFNNDMFEFDNDNKLDLVFNNLLTKIKRKQFTMIQKQNILIELLDNYHLHKHLDRRETEELISINDIEKVNLKIIEIQNEKENLDKKTNKIIKLIEEKMKDPNIKTEDLINLIELNINNLI